MTQQVYLPRISQMGAIVSAFGLWGFSDHMDASSATLLSSAAILIFGLPHGAFDRVVAQGPLTRDADNLRRNVLFLGLYLGIAGSTVALWLHVPALCLGAFLLLSAVHFGCTDVGEGPPALRVLFGGLQGSAPIVLIPYFHPDETAIIFAHLSSAQFARTLVDFIALCAPLWAAATAVFLGWSLLIAANRAASLELLAIVILLALMPPLPGFLLYFGGIHSPKHLADILEELKSGDAPVHPALLEAAIISAVALGGFAAALFWLSSIPLPDHVYDVLFIGLAALTLPHMTLVDGRRVRRTCSRILRQGRRS